MEASPLVQQARPVFQPKIAQLYEQLFMGDLDLAEGYWSEFFLLKPDKSSFQKKLDSVDAEDLLHFQHETQRIFKYAIHHIQAGKAPADEVSLDTLTVFLAGVLSKRYTNPSSDVITVLAGLDEVDTVFGDFANAIESTIRSGRTHVIRRKAIEAALSLTSGAYQTSLVSYFTHRDLFPALMKYVQDCETPGQTFEAFLILGTLANYNKFEYRNPYRIRMEDFVNEATVQKIVQGLGDTCIQARDQYTAIIDDVPDTSWTLSNTLAYIGLGMLAPIKAINPIARPEEDTREKFAVLPDPQAATLLSAYDFVHANKLFGQSLLSTPSQKASAAPFSSYLSFMSYLLHHAHVSSRATLYGLLSLSTLRILAEDSTISKALCNTSFVVRLCRQKPPFLPNANSSRPAAAHILDIAIDTISHNLRRRLDVDLYVASLNLIHRILVTLSTNHIHLPFHWSLLWQVLLTLLRFMQSYATDLQAQSAPPTTLITPLLKIIALAISTGPSFLPDPAAYDDLFYKLVEHADTLTKFKTTYNLSGTSSPIDVLVSTARHFHTILEEEKSKGRLSRTLSPREVQRIVREGYESLAIEGLEGLGVSEWEAWREGDEGNRGLMKRVGRTAVEDVRKLVAQ